MARPLDRLFGLLRPYIRVQKEEALPQEVTDAVTHNIHHSFLHRLPLDLLYYLTTHHVSDPADLLVLRATTRALRFSRIIQEPSAHHRNSCDFPRRLRRDNFTRLCEAEKQERQQQAAASSLPPPPPPPSLIPTWLLQTWRWSAAAAFRSERAPLRICAACQARHPSSHFSAAQLARAPESRRCRGTDDVMRVCPHVALAFATLRRVQERRRKLQWAKLEGFTFERRCRRCPRRGWGDKGARMMGVATGPFLGSGFQRWYYFVERWLRVDGVVVEGGDGTGSVVVSAKTRFSLELALRVLKAMAARHDISVCNHVDLGDPETFETLPCRREGKISEHRCRARLPCHARVYLQWGDLRSRPCVELEVQRFFGVKSPNDKGWIAQIEKLEER